MLAGALALGLGFPLLGGASPVAATEPVEFTEVQRFAPEGGSRAGYSSALAGDTAVYVNRLHGSVDFSRLTDAEAGTWDTVAVDPGIEARGFGIAIAIAADESRAYVSAPSAGQVFVFARGEGNDWSLERTLAPATMPERVTDYRASLGEALAIDGNRLVVGVPNATVDGQRNAGMAFTVDLTTDAWVPLIPAAPIPNSITGQSVAVDGDRVALGAVQAPSAEYLRTGGVYLWDAATLAEPLFTSQPRTDPRVCIARASGGGAAFGISLAFDETSLFVGSPIEISYRGDDPADPEYGCTDQAVTAGNASQGAVYRFSDALEPLGGKIMPPAHSYSFGGSIGVSGNALFASSNQAADGYAGEVHVVDTRALTTEDGDEPGRQRVTTAQTLRASDPAPGAGFGNQVFGHGIATDGVRAIIGAPDARERAGAAYVFEPIIPNVVLTLDATDATVAYGSRTALTATLSDANRDGTVTGTVAGVALEAADVVDGSAELRTPESLLDAGIHPVELAFTATGADAPSATATASLTVTQIASDTTLAVTSSVSPVPDGAGAEPTPPDSAAATAASDATAEVSTGSVLWLGGTVSNELGTAPTGAVVISDGESKLAELPVTSDGSYQMPRDEPGVSVRDNAVFTATFSGDTNHLGSAATLTVEATDPGPGPRPDPDPDPDPDPTVTPPEPGEGLSRTGGDAGLGWALAAGAALLLGAGGALVLRGRTRAHAAARRSDER